MLLQIVLYHQTTPLDWFVAPKSDPNAEKVTLFSDHVIPEPLISSHPFCRHLSPDTFCRKTLPFPMDFSGYYSQMGSHSVSLTSQSTGQSMLPGDKVLNRRLPVFRYFYRTLRALTSHTSLTHLQPNSLRSLKMHDDSQVRIFFYFFRFEKLLLFCRYTKYTINSAVSPHRRGCFWI